MKKNINHLPELIYDSAMTVLYIIVITTLFIYAGKLRETSNFQTERFAERILTDFSLNYYFQNNVDQEWLSSDIRGIGIYNLAGEPLICYGETPDSLKNFYIQDSVLKEYNRKRKSLTYIRAIPPLSSQNRLVFSLDDSSTGKPAFPLTLLEQIDFSENDLVGEWIILYLNQGDFWYKEGNQYRINRLILTTIIPLLLAVLILISGHIYHRFMRSQRQLAEQKNLVLMGTAIRTISHEMKNPLGAIYLQIPLIDKLSEGKVTRETGIIRSEVERMTSLITWISDFLKEPKGMAGELDLRGEMERASRRFPEELNWHLPDHPIQVEIDPERFRSILENLIHNAMESGSAIKQIHVILQKQGNEVFLLVRDRGNGIDREDMKKIFDPFFTRKSRGSGVGLAVTKRFIEAAGGTIRLNSVPEKGTEVIVRFKRKK
ncbi:MAG: HAMP domain-containing sensor histidine kinase [Spirochaetales bacterium]|nr:HAMP domain-containing sensor histidine kinase [Spirochaetales bacterium]